MNLFLDNARSFDLSKVPCAKEGMIKGALAGTTIGVIRFLRTSMAFILPRLAPVSPLRCRVHFFCHQLEYRRLPRYIHGKLVCCQRHHETRTMSIEFLATCREYCRQNRSKAEAELERTIGNMQHYRQAQQKQVLPYKQDRDVSEK